RTRSSKNKNPSSIYEDEEQSYPAPLSKKNRSPIYEDEVEKSCLALSTNKKNKNSTTLQSPITSRSNSFSSKEVEANPEVNRNNFLGNYDHNNQNQHDKHNEFNENNEYEHNEYERNEYIE
ncbi:7813_t:CDS:1, partial [Diversispora eburnea]